MVHNTPMTRPSRSRARHAFLPSGMTSFLRRRASQFMGFLMVCFGILLAATLITYHPSDPSWNLAIDGIARNILAFPGAIMADGMLQSFGIAAAFWVIAFLGWGVRLMVVMPLRWIMLRLLALGVSALLAASVFAQWTPPKTWVLPSHLGGAFGDLLLHQIHEFIGISWMSSLGIGVLFSFLSFILLLSSLGLSFLQIGKGFVLLGTTLKICALVLWQYVGRWLGTPLSSRRETEPAFPARLKSAKEGGLKLSLKPALQGNTSSLPLSSSLHDAEIYTPLTEKPDKPPIIWAEKPSEDPDEKVDQDETPSKRSSYSYDLPPDSYALGGEDYELPSVDLLDASLRKTTQAIDPQVLEESAYQLKTVLEEFGVRGEVVTVRPGPVVTLYEFKPAAGIKTSRVIGLADDIARSMSALSARIAVIPGRNVIGVELPNPTRETVYLRELLQAETYEKSTSNLPLILGKDIGGLPIIADLTRMPHLLVAGTTGSGKSVAVNTMILSLLFRLPPDRCKFIMIDPKMLELSVYDGIPHLLSPVVTDPKKAIVALKWAVREMENRYRAMSKLSVRNIDGYNARVKEARQSGELLVRRVQTGFDPDSGKPIFENQPLALEPLPYIVIVVDEMADLMMVAGKEIEAGVQRLAQMARAAGIHLIMATQRPSVDVITGTIKANFPTRISFQVTSKIDSRTILGEQGAEQLLGQGDMLYMAGGGRITRVHGPFVRDDEVERIVAFLKTQAEPVYIEGVTEDGEESLSFSEDGEKGGDTLYNQAVELVMREGKASTSFIQRHLQIGYNKAAGIIEMMEKNGVVSSANHVGKREVLG